MNGLITEAGKEVDSSGKLTQASYTFGSERIAISYGVSEIDNSVEWENETTTVAWFHNFNANFTAVVEFNQNELDIGGAVEETDTLALGLIANF